MKSFILLVAIGLISWKIFFKYFNTEQPEITNSRIELNFVPISTDSKIEFSCDGRQHCSQMKSRQEAEFFNRYCPNTKMDGDKDGIPCENDSRF